MATPDRQRRIVLHGSIVLIVGLLCGLPSVVEVSTQSGRMWQATHSALLILGVWLLATAAVLPLLLLAEREASALVGSLVLMAYSFTAAVLIQAATGTRAFGPDASPVTTVAFGANVLAVLGAFLSAALTLMGASNGLRASRHGNEPAAAAQPGALRTETGPE